MNVMQCDEARAIYILDGMDRFGHPDWSEVSYEELREECEYTLADLARDESDS